MKKRKTKNQITVFMISGLKIGVQNKGNVIFTFFCRIT